MKIQRKNPQAKLKQKKLKFGEHLQELKNRFLVWFTGFIVLSLIGYLLYQPILNWLIVPLGGPLFYTSPVGALSAVFGVSALFGFILSLPIFFYELVMFLEPAFGTNPLKHILVYILISFFLSLSGVLTAYYLIIPPTLQFLAKFSGGELHALISTGDYFSFLTKYLLGFAILFQFPLVMFIVGKFIKLKPKSLLKYWRHVIVASFIVSGFLTPTPDPVNQTIMATPIVILYLISVITLAFAQKLF